MIMTRDVIKLSCGSIQINMIGVIVSVNDRSNCKCECLGLESDLSLYIGMR